MGYQYLLDNMHLIRTEQTSSNNPHQAFRKRFTIAFIAKDLPKPRKTKLYPPAFSPEGITEEPVFGSYTDEYNW